MTSSPSRRRSWAVALLVTVALITGCTQQNATAPTETPATIPLEVQPRGDQDATSTPTPIPTATAEPTTAVPEPETATEPETPTTAAAADPDVQADDAATASGPSFNDQASEISARGQALGCADATPVRRWLVSSRPSVVEAARPMPDQVWLCPDNEAVNAELKCYPNETTAVLEALREVSEDSSDLVDQVVASGTVFCASGDVIRLGIDDILERVDELNEEAGQ